MNFNLGKCHTDNEGRCFKTSKAIVTSAAVNFRICTPLPGWANLHISFLCPMQAPFSDSGWYQGTQLESDFSLHSATEVEVFTLYAGGGRASV